MKAFLLFLPSLLLLGCMHTSAVQRTLVEGTELLEAKEYAAAAKLFAEGHEDNPSDGRLYYNLALALALDGRQELALQLCDEGYRNWPQILRFLTLKYQILQQLGRSADAINAMDDVLRLTPSDTKLRIEVMEYALDHGFSDEARFHARFLIKERKEMAKAYKVLATLDGPESDAARISAYLEAHPQTT
ncbi:MAG: tetratricopeptide repeat protein [Sphaerochaetaceae bacterium]|nr:tetratricopeptide repeat protein [Spirochaetales bacterium]MDY5498530.1 tetratricopeptide repeat protein [Sphaerochaetaceae bacterium]